MFGCQDDKSLVDACRAGRTEAFGVLVSRYQDRLYPTVLRLAGCAEDAQDIMQDAFLRAFQKLDHFHGESSFYTWVYRIAVNLTLSGHRRRRGAAGRRRDESRGRALETARDPRDNDPSAPLERSERDRVVQNALNSLAPDHRAVVVLKEFDGLPYEEIGAILGVPVGTVRSRLHRARRELRERLQGLVAEEAATAHRIHAH